jgi:hypothetical protein
MPYVIVVTPSFPGLNTRGVIEDRLPDLDTVQENDYPTSYGSLRTTFTKQIIKWECFKEDVVSFNNSDITKKHFSWTEKLHVGNPYYIDNTLETITVGT